MEHKRAKRARNRAAEPWDEKVNLTFLACLHHTPSRRIALLFVARTRDSRVSHLDQILSRAHGASHIIKSVTCNTLDLSEALLTVCHCGVGWRGGGGGTGDMLGVVALICWQPAIIGMWIILKQRKRITLNVIKSMQGSIACRRRFQT